MNLMKKNILVLSMLGSLVLNFSKIVWAESIDDVPGSVSELPENEHLMTQIRYEYGHILEPQDYPAIYKVLAHIFSDLSFAQGRLTEGAAATINYVHLVESDQLNAFVWTDNKIGIRLFANHVFLTTEMLRFMMMGVPLELGLERIAGVIAHELGHPMDQTSLYQGEGGISIDNHYGEESSQAQEIRADIDATRILREANYPVDSLYKTLSHLFGKEQNTHSSFTEAMASSHPHSDFRLTSARLFLTLDRLEKGILKNSKIDIGDSKNLKDFEIELEKVIPKNGRFPYQVPKSLVEMGDRLEAVISDTDLSAGFRELEFNRLILSFDSLLFEKQKKHKQLTAKERIQFLRFLKNVYLGLTNDFPLDVSIYHALEIRAKINKVSGYSGLEKSRSHSYFVENLEVFKSPEVRAYLQEIASTILTEDRFLEPWDSRVTRDIIAAASISDPDLFFNQFGKFLINHIQKMWIVPPDNNKIQNQGIGQAQYTIEEFSNLGFRYQTKFAKILEPFRTEAQRSGGLGLRLFYEKIAKLWLPIPLINQFTEKNENSILLKYRQALVYLRSGQHPEVEEYVNEIKKICLDVWDHKGFYGSLEILFAGNMIDWTFIFEVLNLQPQVAKNQIESEVQKYMTGLKVYRDILPYQDLMYTINNSQNDKKKLDHKGIPSWLIWNSRSLKKAMQKTDPDDLNLQVQPKNQIQEIYRIKQKKVFVKDYMDSLASVIGISTKKPDAIRKLLLEFAFAHKQFVGKNSAQVAEIDSWDKNYFLETQLFLIEKAQLTHSEKQKWFEALFLKKIKMNNLLDQQDWQQFHKQLHHHNEYEAEDTWAISYMSDTDINEHVIKVFKLIFENKTAIDFFYRLQSYARNLNLEDSSYFRALDASEKLLQPDLKTVRLNDFADLMNLLELFKPILHRKIVYESGLMENEYTTEESLSNSQSAQMNSARIQRLKRTVLERVKDLPMTFEQKIEFFVSITESGPTRETDKLFLSFIDTNMMSGDLKVKVLEFLSEGRFSSDKLKLELAKIFIGGRVSFLKKEFIDSGKKVDRYTLERLIKDFNYYAPNGSIAKDDFLESIGWSLKLRGSELDGFIDDQKSANWRRANPMLIRVGSLLASQISNMSYEGRLNMIEYFLDPVNKETKLFSDILEELKKITYLDLLKSLKGTLTVAQQNALKKKADRIAEIIKLKSEEAIRDSAPSERIPLFEVVLTAGQDAIVNRKNWQTEISRQFLKYLPNSMEETLLTTFLEVLPRHEHSVALSYMLSLANSEENGSISQLFEVFGTVGIKFGQLASIWEIFGKKNAEDSKHLKNHAKALGRAEVIRLANERHHEIRCLVEEFNKILGSASIKTSVEVSMKDGSTAVLAMQREHVRDIVAMNIQLGKQFIELLKQKNIIKNSKFMMNLIEALEEQIVAELNMKTEAIKTQNADDILKSVSKDMKHELNGWKIKPALSKKNLPITEELAFYELAGSVSYDRLTDDLKKIVGPIIVKANLVSLFSYARFDPDRHTGNFLVNPKTKTIFFLDFGQYENFSKSPNPFAYEPRLTIALFIKSLVELNSKDTLHYATLMSRSDHISLIQKEKIIEVLDLIFKQARLQSSPDIKQLVVDVINGIAEGGLKFETRYIFGALKGLLILYGENYVDAQSFQNILRDQIRKLLIAKSPALLIEKAKVSTEDLINLGSRGRSMLKKSIGGGIRIIRCDDVFGSINY